MLCCIVCGTCTGVWRLHNCAHVFGGQRLGIFLYSALVYNRISHCTRNSPFRLDWLAAQFLGSACVHPLVLRFQACVALPGFIPELQRFDPLLPTKLSQLRFHKCKGRMPHFTFLLSLRTSVRISVC